MSPNFREEKKLSKKGYKFIIGIDEVGRGPLAGPVVACAFCFDFGTKPGFLKEARLLSSIRDSKQLSHKKREEIYKLLKKDSNIEWGIGRAYPQMIDEINILQATKLAMKRAVINLKKKIKTHNREFLLIDGNFGIDISIPQKSIIKGDQKVLSISAASIIAKVTRDRLMVNYHKKYPQYCFDKHKGYGSQLHRDLIKKHGRCSLHRQTFHLK